MASKNINVLMSLVDNFSAPMQKCSGKMSDAEKQARRTANALNGFGSKLNNMAVSAAKFGAGLAAAGYAMAVAGIKQMADQSVEAAKVQLMAETQLESVLKNVTAITERGAGAVEKATAGLKAYAGELQNAGVIGDEVTLSGMSQLAMYQMTDDQIKQLSGGMLDLLAKQKGLNATQEDAVAVANAIGKAYSGNVNALSRMGIKLTEAEQNAIKFGDANQRSAAIAQILQSRVGGVNAALAKTDMGRQQQAMNAYGDMLEEIGKKLIPMKAQLWGVFGAILPKLQGALLPVMDKLYAKFEAAMPQIERMAQMFADKLPGAIETVANGILWLIENFDSIIDTVNTLTPVLAGVVAGFAAFNIISTVAGLIYTVTTAIGGATTAMGIFNAVLIANPIGLVAAAIGILIAALVALYRNFDKVKAAAKSAWEYISNIKFPSFPSFGGGGGENPQGNAMGTPYFRGGLTRVNERGGELINLPSGSQIIPHDLSRAAVSGSRSQNINITLNVAGNVIGNEDFYNQCGNAITERLTAALANM